MDISEWIGFIVSLLALFYLMIRQGREIARQKNHPEEYAEQERQEKRRLKEVLRTMNLELEEEEDEIEEEVFQQPKRLPPPPPAIRVRKPRYEPVRSRVEKEVLHEKTPSHMRVHGLLRRVPSRRDMILVREIIGPPKCAQPIRHHEFWG